MWFDANCTRQTTLVHGNSWLCVFLSFGKIARRPKKVCESPCSNLGKLTNAKIISRKSRDVNDGIEILTMSLTIFLCTACTVTVPRALIHKQCCSDSIAVSTLFPIWTVIGALFVEKYYTRKRKLYKYLTVWFIQLLSVYWS